MARRRSSNPRQDRQIDPFNAGDPIMPWDEPGNSEAAPAQAAEKPRADSDPAPVADHGSAAPGELEPPEPRHAAAPQQPGAPSSPGIGRDAAAAAAPKAAKGHGPKRKGFKARYIFIGIFIVLAVRACMADGLDTATDTTPSSSETESGGSEETLSYEDEQALQKKDEKDISEQVSDKLDALGDDQDAHALLVEGISNKIQSYMGYTPEQLGLDTESAADWFMSNFSYSIDSAYAYRDSNTGNVNVAIEAPVVYQLASNLYNEASDYLLDNHLYGNSDPTQNQPLTPEQQEQIESFFRTALDSTETQSGQSMYLTFSFQGGSWVMEQKSWDDGLKYLFGAN